MYVCLIVLLRAGRDRADACDLLAVSSQKEGMWRGCFSGNYPNSNPAGASHVDVLSYRDNGMTTDLI